MAAGETLLPYGLGRSQGDSCLNDGGVLLDTSSLNRFVAFDETAGTITCEAGVTVADILELVVPHGYVLPVIPGTKYVTVGGAIANDVHGKNHVTSGTFGRHVITFELLRSDGRYQCSPKLHPKLFAATIGGLGLTGLITRATVQLKKVPSPWVTTRRVPFTTLAEGMQSIQGLSGRHEYIIGQFDALSQRTAGRGVLIVGDHAAAADQATPRLTSRTVPRPAPNWLLNDLAMKAFNTWYHFRQTHTAAVQPVYYDPYFFPLDSLRYWNRLYGNRGFVQYQAVVPAAAATVVYANILQELLRRRHGSYLGSLKIFGELPSPGLLSFPRPGIVVALDFPMRGTTTLTLLEQFDRWVVDSGGAVYPAKDARLSAASFQAYYPRWQEFKQYLDPAFSSSFWRRVSRAASVAF